MYREAANTIAHRNGVTAQALRVFGTWTDASNYEVGIFDWTTNAGTFNIGTHKLGTGSTRAMNIYIGGGLKWQIGAAANTAYADFLFGNDNTNDIGASGATRPRSIYAGTSITSPLLIVTGDTVRIATSKTPASASATGTTGDHCWDSTYVYVCVATDTWKRAALATW